MASLSCTRPPVTLTGRAIIHNGSGLCNLLSMSPRQTTSIRVNPRAIHYAASFAISGAYCWTHARSCSFLIAVYEHDAKNSITTDELSQCCTRRVQGHGRPGVLSEGVRHRTNLDRAGQAPGVANEWLCLLHRQSHEEIAFWRRIEPTSLSAQRMARCKLLQRTGTGCFRVGGSCNSDLRVTD